MVEIDGPKTDGAGRRSDEQHADRLAAGNHRNGQCGTGPVNTVTR